MYLNAGSLQSLPGCGFLVCAVVVFLAAVVGEFEHFGDCSAKATFIIIRLVCTP